MHMNISKKFNIQKVNKALIILSLLILSCNFINTDSKRIEQANNYKRFFFENKEQLEQITEKVLRNKKLILKSGQKIEEQLKTLKIENIVITKNSCETFEVEYRTSWTKYPIGTMYLTMNVCESTKYPNGSYVNFGFIEVWGLGEGWILWVDSDFI